VTVKTPEEDTLTTGDPRAVESLPGSSPRSPPRANVYAPPELSGVGDSTDDLQQREGPAWALAEDTGSTDDRPAIERGTTWEPTFDAWRRDARRSLRPGTLHNYELHLRDTFAWLGKAIPDISYPDLTAALSNWEEEWEDDIRNPEGRPIQRGTYNGRISALRHFFDYCIRKEGMEIPNPAEKLDRPRRDDIEVEEKAYEPIPRATFAEIVRLAQADQHHRFVVAAKFAWTTMARIGELYALRWRDLDFDRKAVVVRKPKRGGPKEKNLYEGLLKDLAWLRDHHRGEADHLVFRRPGQSPGAFREWFDACLKRYARQAGHPTYVHPHLVRASAATDHSERGVPVRDIMLQGGWTTLSSLTKYLREDDGARRKRMEAGCDL
jgi:integrase